MFNNNDNPFKGTYLVIEDGNPENVISKHEVSSKEEFETLLSQVNIYNNASDNKKHQIIKQPI